MCKYVKLQAGYKINLPFKMGFVYDDLNFL